jgi:hypothetical protein
MLSIEIVDIPVFVFVAAIKTVGQTSGPITCGK